MIKESHAVGIFRANLKLYGLLDNEVEDADDYKQTCQEGEDCITLVDLDEASEHDGACQKCWNATHFDCCECNAEFHHDDEHESCKGYCVECGCAKLREKADDLWESIESIVGGWADEADEISKLKKLLSYVKKMNK